MGWAFCEGREGLKKSTGQRWPTTEADHRAMGLAVAGKCNGEGGAPGYLLRLRCSVQPRRGIGNPCGPEIIPPFFPNEPQALILANQVLHAGRSQV